MRRVAITGIGIVSSIGNNVSEVTNSLRNGTSGIVAAPEYTELGFRSQVHGTVKLDVADHVDRKQLRFMGEGAAYAVLAMEQAIADAELEAKKTHIDATSSDDGNLPREAFCVVKFFIKIAGLLFAGESELFKALINPLVLIKTGHTELILMPLGPNSLESA